MVRCVLWSLQSYFHLSVYLPWIPTVYLSYLGTLVSNNALSIVWPSPNPLRTEPSWSLTTVWTCPYRIFLRGYIPARPVFLRYGFWTISIFGCSGTPYSTGYFRIVVNFVFTCPVMSPVLETAVSKSWTLTSVLPGTTAAAMHIAFTPLSWDEQYELAQCYISIYASISTNSPYPNKEQAAVTCTGIHRWTLMCSTIVHFLASPTSPWYPVIPELDGWMLPAILVFTNWSFYFMKQHARLVSYFFLMMHLLS